MISDALFEKEVREWFTIENGKYIRVFGKPLAVVSSYPVYREGDTGEYASLGIHMLNYFRLDSWVKDNLSLILNSNTDIKELFNKRVKYNKERKGDFITDLDKYLASDIGKQYYSKIDSKLVKLTYPTPISEYRKFGVPLEGVEAQGVAYNGVKAFIVYTVVNTVYKNKQRIEEIEYVVSYMGLRCKSKSKSELIIKFVALWLYYQNIQVTELDTLELERMTHPVEEVKKVLSCINLKKVLKLEPTYYYNGRSGIIVYYNDEAVATLNPSFHDRQAWVLQTPYFQYTVPGIPSNNLANRVMGIISQPLHRGSAGVIKSYLIENRVSSPFEFVDCTPKEVGLVDISRECQKVFVGGSYIGAISRSVDSPGWYARRDIYTDAYGYYKLDVAYVLAMRVLGDERYKINKGGN
ncbi:hypothetical protein D3C71_1094340 [compost metagenome]